MEASRGQSLPSVWRDVLAEASYRIDLGALLSCFPAPITPLGRSGRSATSLCYGVVLPLRRPVDLFFFPPSPYSTSFCPYSILSLFSLACSAFHAFASPSLCFPLPSPLASSGTALFARPSALSLCLLPPIFLSVFCETRGRYCLHLLPPNLFPFGLCRPPRCPGDGRSMCTLLRASPPHRQEQQTPMAQSPTDCRGRYPTGA